MNKRNRILSELKSTVETLENISYVLDDLLELTTTATEIKTTTEEEKTVVLSETKMAMMDTDGVEEVDKSRSNSTDTTSRRNYGHTVTTPMIANTSAAAEKKCNNSKSIARKQELLLYELKKWNQIL